MTLNPTLFWIFLTNEIAFLKWIWRICVKIK